jgi:hypothetical protein
MTNVSRKHKHWTASEDRTLRRLWGHVHAEQIARRLNRTAYAIYNRAIELELGRPATRAGYLSLKQACEKTGYHKERIRNVCKVLGITLAPLPRSGATAQPKYQKKFCWKGLSEGDFDRVVAFLIENPVAYFTTVPVGVWGIRGRPKRCERCKTTDRPHRAKGMCSPCYDKVRRAPRPPARASVSSPG